MNTCSYCGKQFEGNRRRKYCSEECSTAAQRERFKLWYSINKVEHNKKCNEYNKNHREQCREAQQRFHERHPEKIKEYRAKHRRNATKVDNTLEN